MKTHQETRWAPATATKLLASSAARKAWSWSRWFAWVWVFSPENSSDHQDEPFENEPKSPKKTPFQKENSLPNIIFIGGI